MLVPQPGARIGRYQLLEELGRGGMAIVFRALDPVLRREVALKVMHAHLWGTAEYAARFAREARAVAALRHPNIVEVYDFSEGSGEGEQAVPGYIVSELVRGPSLRQFVELHGRPLPEVAALIALKLGQALTCAHQRGIIHRDLKPENVMIAEGGRVVLTDFGIARVTEGESVTQTGALIGSPAYMAPEQARGLHVDARADLFSLGVVLYQLCTGTLPFPGKDPISTVLRVLDGTFEPPLKLNPQIGGSLDRLLRRLLQADPASRPASAEELCACLQAVLAETELRDADAELRAYFAAPGEYNQQLVLRIIEASLRAARAASEQRDPARVLRFCDRVLAFVPGQPEALALMREQQASPRRWPLLVGGALVLGGTATWGLAHWGYRSPRAGTASGVPGRGSDAASPDAGRQARPDASARRREALPAPEAGPVSRRAAPIKRPARRGPAAALVADARSRPALLDAGTRPTPVINKEPAKAELRVQLGPYCDLSIDGRPAGRSPLASPLELDPGTYQVVCVHRPTGAVFRRAIRLRAGERHTLSGPVQAEVRVRLSLKRGDAVRIDGKRYSAAGGDLVLPAGRRRVEVLRGEAMVASAWVSLFRDCTLVDEPSLGCR